MSAKLPVVATRKVVRAFERHGFVVLEKRGKGSHIVMAHAEKGAILTIPRQDPIKRGTLRALIRAAGLTVEEFVEAL